MTMMNDNEIRMKAVQAAATCAVSVGLGEPEGVLKVAEMFEAYIAGGAQSARKVIESWDAPAAPKGQPMGASSPDTHIAPDGDSPTAPRAQELAQEAYTASTREQVSAVGKIAKQHNLGGEKIVIDGSEATLGAYINSRWTATQSSVPLNERNRNAKHSGKAGFAAMRSDLGL